MRKINLKVNNTKVPIIIGREILKTVNPSEYVSKNDVAIVTNSTVAKLYLQQTKRLFKEFNVTSLVLPDGEKHKNIQTLQKIYNFLIKSKLDRSLTIVALGGGVIGDMVAFAADTFMRGVDLIHIPTTLLAQVDSSIGGKCGINHPMGKNLMGSFKHPKVIIMDTATLKTLPKREFMAGMAEVIKYGLIKNKSVFKFIDRLMKPGPAMSGGLHILTKSLSFCSWSAICCAILRGGCFISFASAKAQFIWKSPNSGLDAGTKLEPVSIEEVVELLFSFGNTLMKALLRASSNLADISSILFMVR